jgi:6-phosphogluconolactonase
MKTRSLPIIFVLAINFTFISHAIPEIIDNTSDKSACYIYVSVNKEKKILIYKLDPINENLLLWGEQNLAGEPGSLCTDPQQRRMYAALRDLNSVASLNIDKKSGRLKHLKDTPVAENPVYISTDRKGKFLFFTSYSGNKNAVYKLIREGVNKDPVQVMDARQNPHMIKTDPLGKYVFVTNKGGDIVQQFIFQDDGLLRSNNPEGVVVKTKSGPRHLTFDPHGGIMYVVNELSCTIVAFHFDKINGTLTGPFQEITTKPVNYTSYNTCADIHITPDGKFIYASNRGHDSLAGFSIDPGSGELTPIGWFPTEKEPREFEIDPSGKFLIAAGESSGRIAFYRIQSDGSLLLLKTYETGKWPVWVMSIVF